MEQDLFSLYAESRRYSRYEARIKALGRILDTLRRHRIAVAAGALLVILAIFGFLLTMGTFTGDLRCEDLIYGDTPQCSLKAFLSDVRYQYAAADGEAFWSDDAPTLPGRYRIRAVSKNGFGQPKYSDAMTLTLLPRDLNVQIHPGTFVYGEFSTAITRESTELIGLAAGDQPDQLEYAISEDDSGNLAASVKVLQVINRAGQDVTACYRITTTDGYFTMTPRPITVRTEDAQKIYDGKEWNAAEGSLTKGTLVDGDRLQISFSPHPATVGAYPIKPQCAVYTADGQNVTACYQISTVNGILTVLPRPITVQTGSAAKEYDDTPLTNSDWSLLEGEPVPGHELIGVVTGSQTAAGQSSNTIILNVLDAEGINVSGNYALTAETGTLTVTPITLKFETDSREKVYDGLVLADDGCRLLSGKVLNRHSLTYWTTGGQIDAGSSSNTLAVLVRDADGYNVTAEGYQIVMDLGTLTVMPRPITITSGSAEKLYDGYPLTCHTFETNDGAFDFGSWDEQVSQTFFTGSQTRVGSSANTFTAEIADYSGNVTTHNYNITYIYGTLTVLENPNPPEQGGDIGGDRTDPEIPPRGEDVTVTYPDSSGETLYALVDAFIGPENPERLYFRDQSYGDYTGSGWQAATPYPINSVSPLEFAGSSMREEFGLSIHRINNCPALLPYYMVLDNNPCPQETDCYYLQDKLSYNLYLSTGYTYRDLKNMTVSPTLESEEMAYRRFVHEEYLQIPESTKQALLDWAARNGIRANSPTLVEDIQSAITNAAVYNLNGAEYPQNVDVAVYFLTEAKEGICQHFATAATLMYRAFDIPARYTVGFVDTVMEDETTELTSRDAHAWVEIYVDGLGWVPMEVTGAGFTGIPEDVKTTLCIQAYSAVKIYDGKGFEQFDLARYTIVSGSLRKGHRLEVTFASNENAVLPGEYVNQIERCIVYDENGKDVTSKYYNIPNYVGTLTILPRQITVTIGSATKAYDGNALTCHDYWISEGSLAPGHELDVTIDAFLQDPGCTENTASEIRILYEDRAGMLVDATDCYEITVMPGTLEIAQPEPGTDGT